MALGRTTQKYAGPRFLGLQHRQALAFNVGPSPMTEDIVT